MAGWVVLAIQMVSHPPRELRRGDLRVSRGVKIVFIVFNLVPYVALLIVG